MKQIQGKRLRFFTKCAVFTALLAVIAPFSINIGPVPISLATFAIYLASAVLGCEGGVFSVIAYLLLGAVGIPVFSGFSGGLQKLIGPTGGYLIGYIFLALTVGFISDRLSGAAFKEGWKKKLRPVFNVLGMVIGTAVLYAFGTAWFMFITGNSLGSSMTMCVIPFLAGDTVKIIAAAAVCEFLRAAIPGIINKENS